MSQTILLEGGLLFFSLSHSLCMRLARDISTVNVLSGLFIVSSVATISAILQITLRGSGFRQTFAGTSKKTMITIMSIDVFTDFLNTLPLLLPRMSITLHAILQRSQIAFSIPINLWMGKPITLRETLAAAISTLGVIVYVYEDVSSKPPKDTQSSLDGIFIMGIISVVVSKIAMEMSQIVEMEAVQKGTPKAGVLLLTNVLGAPLVLILMQLGDSKETLEPIKPVMRILIMAGLSQTAYLSLKMLAHKRQVSSLTHAFIVNVRSIINICIGILPFDWSPGLWIAVICMIISTCIKYMPSRQSPLSV